MPYSKEYYQKNRERELAKHKAYNAAHREHLLGVAKKWREKDRMACLEHYSSSPPQCKCCGENRLQFLCIDHTNGGGSAHRKKEFGGGGNINRWLIKNNFPEGFRVLCHNCNLSLGFYGYCPHGGDKTT